MAKDQGITRVVVVVVVAVLCHSSHFVNKRNLCETNYPKPGFKPGTFTIPVKSYRDIVTLLFEKLKDFKKPRRRPCASPGSSFILKRECLVSLSSVVDIKRPS